MELFEQIRREYDHGVGTIKGVARKLGIHRRMVREALGDAVPRERKINTRGKPRIEPAKAFIEAILQGDEKAPRKQRHTAHRIWSRIRKELPEVGVAESSIRRYVRERKIELKLIKHETFIPQSYVWGQEAQVDWYEAYADIGGRARKGLRILHAQHGQWRSVPLRLPARQSASVFGGARASLCLFRGSIRTLSV